MGKYSKSFFENPYLDEESKKKLTADMVLDEAREKWRVRTNTPDDIDLSIEEGTLDGEGDSVARPSSDRFTLTESDLKGAPIPLSVIRALDYSPSYRPVGELEEKAAGVPMSTADRYDILAGDYEAPPDDVSFLRDADARLEKLSDGKRSGKLRRDTRRLDTSVDERRRELMHLLPDRDSKKTERIVKDVRRKKEREKIEREGNLSLSKADPKKAPVRKVTAIPEDEADAFRVRKLNSSRYDRLPLQEGFEFELPEAVELDSQSRDWRSIRSENPKWSEIQKYSSHTVPEEEERYERFEAEQDSDFRAHYIRDEDYDPERRYTIKIANPRERLRSAEGLNFENEYIKDLGLDSERVRELVEKDYRGRWVPPEFFYDDELVNEWFGRYNRGLNDGEDFIHWAAKQRRAAMNVQMGFPITGDIVFEPERPAPKHAAVRPVPQPQPDPRAVRDEERRRLYNQAMQAGYEQGAAIARDRRNAPVQKPTYRGQYPDLFTASRPPVPPGYSPYPPMPHGVRPGIDSRSRYARERTGEYLPRATMSAPAQPPITAAPTLSQSAAKTNEPLLARKEAMKTYPTPTPKAKAEPLSAESKTSAEFVFGSLEDDFVE